ncbi:MAG: ABC transporter ATP-binding protein [Planctomycetota bacterium]
MIDVADLVFTYPGAPVPTVRGISFEIGEGEIFGFLGPSGAGKSTTQNILIGLLQGWEGRVQVGGRPLTEWGGAYNERIGVSFELPNQYSKLTARENLEFFRSLYAGETETPEAVLAQVGLADHIDKPAGDFSKGMKNRLNFARSMINRPDLWFLDEPTSGLDPVSSRHMRGVIRDRGVTTFVTTHDMVTADEICDRVAFIVDGQLAAIDAPEALRRQYGKHEVEIEWGADGAKHSARYPLDGLGEQAEFQRVLREEHVLSIHSLETTLEDVFIQVTGRSLS